MRSRLAILLLGLLSWSSANAWGKEPPPTHSHESRESRDVVVMGGGTAFRDAVSVALSPWSLRVVTSTATVPSTEAPRAAREARAITEKQDAISVVWVAVSHDKETALFVYDRESDQLISRALTTSPPFDAALAASAALSVKTLLRSSTVAPVEERIGAEAVREPSPASVSPPPSPTSKEAVAAEEHSSAFALAQPSSKLGIEMSAAARVIASDVDTRIGLGIAYLLDRDGRFGLGLTVYGGPGLAVTSDRFRGRFSELALTPTFRVRLPVSSVSRRLFLEPRVGMTIHATKIDGVAVPTTKLSQGAERARLDASADAAVVVALVLTRSTSVGLEMSGSYMLRYQRYRVENEEVFDLAPIQGMLGIRLGVSVW